MQFVYCCVCTYVRTHTILHSPMNLQMQTTVTSLTGCNWSFLFHACNTGQNSLRINTSLVHCHPSTLQDKLRRLRMRSASGLSWGGPLNCWTLTTDTFELVCRILTIPRVACCRVSLVNCLQPQNRYSDL